MQGPKANVDSRSVCVPLKRGGWDERQVAAEGTGHISNGQSKEKAIGCMCQVLVVNAERGTCVLASPVQVGCRGIGVGPLERHQADQGPGAHVLEKRG